MLHIECVQKSMGCLGAEGFFVPQSRSAQRALEPVLVQVVGPFLGVSCPGSIRIVIGLPHLAPKRFECILLDESDAVKDRKFADKRCGLFNVYSFDFNGLTPDAVYSYRFEADGAPIDLQGGLTCTDCRFRATKEFSQEDAFLLVSCHNPFEIKKGSADDGWAMWRRLREQVETDRSIQFLVLGGDQVYNDDVEVEYLERIKRSPDDKKLQDKVRERFIRQYQIFWENLDYRKVMARIPSIAMWDDHDITDGWGGRPESFDETEIIEPWRQYFFLAKEAFLAYQASRNPSPLAGLPNGPLSFLHDFGPNRIYMLDHRAERNSAKRILWSKEHRELFFDSLLTIPDSIERVFVLCPTVPFRTNFDEDRRLGTLSKHLFVYVQEMEKRKKLRKFLRHVLCLLPILWVGSLAAVFLDYMGIVNLSWPYIELGRLLLLEGLVVFFFWLFLFAIAGTAELILRVPELPRLTDDLEDGLSADGNRGSLKEILRHLFELRIQRGKQVAILSGDIHLAGVTEIIDLRQNNAVSILQVVSSPIACQPMPKAVEGFSTTTSEMVLGDELSRSPFARNIFYTSKRNFAQIIPARIQDRSNLPPFYFYLEGHRVALAIPSTFLPQ